MGESAWDSPEGATGLSLTDSSAFRMANGSGPRVRSEPAVLPTWTIRVDEVFGLVTATVTSGGLLSMTDRAPSIWPAGPESVMATTLQGTLPSKLTGARSIGTLTLKQLSMAI
ncbi:MAG: hypothetical protein FD129_2106 [bacterium]|nr:MAG: hypothetical protein FD129_2106 [bacterium]